MTSTFSKISITTGASATTSSASASTSTSTSSRTFMEKMENVVVKYDTATNRIAVKGKTIKIVLTINQDQMMRAYSGEEGKATVLVSIMEDLNDGVI